MPVKIKINQSAVEGKIAGAWKKALPILAGEIRDDCNEFCKEDTGTLIASSMIASRLEDGQIIWDTPYARRQYWEIKTAYTDRNPQARWRWCEAAKRKYSAEWQRKAQALLEANL